METTEIRTEEQVVGAAPRRVLVLGGYGHFGARICRELARDGEFEVVVAGRNLARAEELASDLKARFSTGDIRAARMDHAGEGFLDELRSIDPALVIHTAGPFQGQDYRVAEACVATGCHYIDLADSRRFVCDFAALNQRALDNDLLLVTGASTLPGVSSAVIDELADGIELEGVEISIAPANQTPRGRGTIAGVLSYCGKGFDVLEDHRLVRTYGWQDLRRVSYRGFKRLAGACDVPDLELFPIHYQGIGTVRFHAALELGWQQWGLWSMAWLGRLRLVSDWGRFAAAFYWISERLQSFGTDEGAMRVHVWGRDTARQRIDRTWLLRAGQNHGPEIPCVPAVVLARRMLRGGPRERNGALPCVSLITLDEFAAATPLLDIDWQVTERSRAQ